MTRPPTRNDLIDLALDRLTPDERERIETQVRQSPALEREARQVADHLARYDALVPPRPPPAPAVETSIRPTTGDRVRARAGVLVAAAALVLLFLWQPWVRAPLGVQSPSLVRVGGDLRATDVGSLTLGDGALRLVLAPRTRLRLESEHVVHLHRGRIYVEVRPGHPFAVKTLHGDARVLGTRFEVALEGDALQVAVEEGRVECASHVLEAGQLLAGGRVRRWTELPGRFFRLPGLRIEAGPDQRSGEALRLELVLEAHGDVAAEAPTPGATPTPMWITIRDPLGAVHDIAIPGDGRPFGLDTSRTIEPGEPLRHTVRLPHTLQHVGTYGCRAMYRPERGAPVISPEVRVEIRE